MKINTTPDTQKIRFAIIGDTSLNLDAVTHVGLSESIQETGSRDNRIRTRTGSLRVHFSSGAHRDFSHDCDGFYQLADKYGFDCSNKFFGETGKARG